MVAKKYAAKKKLKILLFIIDHSGRKYSTMIFITTHLIMHSVSKLIGNWKFFQLEIEYFNNNNDWQNGMINDNKIDISLSESVTLW